MGSSVKRTLGISLIEILVGLVIVTILSTLIAYIYQSFVKSRLEQRVATEREIDLLNAQIYLEKLITSIGFGEPAYLFNINTSFQCSDNNLSTFKNSAFVLAIAPNCADTNIPTHDRLYFRSLYANSKEEAGCWYIKTATMDVSNFIISHTKYLGKCTIDANDICRTLDVQKLTEVEEYCGYIINKNRASIAYYLKTEGSDNTPLVFRLHLSEQTEPYRYLRCAPKTGRLMFQREQNINTSPVAYCLGGMRFDLLNGTGTVPYAIRMCLLVQTSDRRSSKTDVPLQSNCTRAFVKADSSWDFYRWRVIEEIIPLYNIW